MGKCEFFEVCRLADKDSVTCTKTDGDYYGPGRMAGCGRDLMKFGSKSTYHKDNLASIIENKNSKKKIVKLKQRIRKG